MKFKVICVVLLISATLAPCISAQQSDFPVLTGPYLGQNPPGVYPELFAPGIVSVEENFEHSAAVFSPDGSEVYWCTNVGWYTEQGQQANPNPDLSYGGEFADSAEAAGLKYKQLLERIVRFGLNYRPQWSGS